MSEPPGPRYRIDDLAARCGLPVRTIREYQTWKLLDPPTREGRIGWYDESHVRRLETIRQLQQRGYSIAGIRDLLSAWAAGSGLERVLGGAQDPPVAAIDEAPVLFTGEALAQLLPGVVSSPRLLGRLTRSGVVVRHGDHYAARSPALLTLLADTMAAGLPASDAIEVGRAIVDATDTAGRKVAAAIGRLATQGGTEAVEPLLRRGRVLVGRALASHTVDRIARHLLEDAGPDRAIVDLVESLRIGAPIREQPTTG